MKLTSTTETMSVEDEVAQVAFDLTGSVAEYLSISSPGGPDATDEFFGHDHYVEVKDQRFGRYGGLSKLKVNGEDNVEIGLAYEVPEIGNQLTIVTRAAMPPRILSHLRKLERP